MTRWTFGLVSVAACGASEPSARVDLAPAPEKDAGGEAETPQSGALGAFTAAERLARDGKHAEARVAFTQVVRLYPYSRFAKDAELRIAEVDEALGDRAASVRELRTWAKHHPSDPRAPEVIERATTVGDRACHADADCVMVQKPGCCDCCPSGPFATSGRWAAAHDADCRRSLCGACNQTCSSLEGARAVCNAGLCTLAAPLADDLE